MEIKELRLGNKIDAGNGVIGTIDGLLFDGKISTNCGTGHISEFKPLPLSEKILTDFVFTLVRVPSAYGYDCNKVFNGGVFRGAWNGKSYFYLNFIIHGGHKEIKYVHLLQNLFFDLTDQELPV